MWAVTRIILEVSIDTRQSWFAWDCLSFPGRNCVRLLPVPQVLLSVPEVSSCGLSSWFIRRGIDDRDGIGDGEYLPALTLILNIAMLGDGEANGGIQRIGRRRGTFDEFAGGHGEPTKRLQKIARGGRTFCNNHQQ